MNNQEIIDNNKLIAIFMDNYDKLSNDPEFGRFHLQWDWLMPVIEKITSIELSNGAEECSYIYIGWEYETKEHYVNLFIWGDRQINGNSKISKIDAVYEAVINFIKWYNEQNK